MSYFYDPLPINGIINRPKLCFKLLNSLLVIEYTLLNVLILEFEIYYGPEKFHGRSNFGQYDEIKNRVPFLDLDLYSPIPVPWSNFSVCIFAINAKSRNIPPREDFNASSINNTKGENIFYLHIPRILVDIYACIHPHTEMLPPI